MKKEVLFILLNDFADWEGAYIASSLNFGIDPANESKYIVKTVSLTKDPVVSAGGFMVLPHYQLSDITTDYAALVLIGGMRWFTPEAELFVPLIKQAIQSNKLVAAICNASVFLGMHGLLNGVNHTSNGLEYIKSYAGVGYTASEYYINEPAVRDGNIVTANGFAALEFCREVLYGLEAGTAQKIEQSYRMNKTGIWESPDME